jgi:hypothetical protein
MKALAGHMSRAMLERYSHIRLKAKRAAMEGVRLPQENVAPTDSPTVEHPTSVQ